MAATADLKHMNLPDVLALQQQCPAFAKGCPFATQAGMTEKAKQCPAFASGCPFANKSADEIQKLVASIPANHPHCPASLTSVSAICSDGRPLFDALHQLRDDLFDSKSVHLAAELKEGTKVSHEAAHRLPFVGRIFKLEITKKEFAAYLGKLYHVYSTMEREMERLKQNEFVRPLYFPDHVSRTQSIEEDLQYYLGPGWKDAPEVAQISPAVANYRQRLQQVGKTNPMLLVAHCYTRYLGDLSGGQMMAPKARKAMNLPEGKGTSFFDFKNIDSPKEFKEIYRNRLNGLPVTAAQADEIVAEANLSFKLTTNIFEELAQMSTQNGDDSAPASKRSRSCGKASSLQGPFVVAAVLLAAAAAYWQLVH